MKAMLTAVIFIEQEQESLSICEQGSICCARTGMSGMGPD